MPLYFFTLETDLIPCLITSPITINKCDFFFFFLKLQKIKSTRKRQREQACEHSGRAVVHPQHEGATERAEKPLSRVNDTKKRWPGVNMASALDDDEILNDDYYSLLNVRREVQHAVAVWMGVCAGQCSSRPVNSRPLILNGDSYNHT